MNTNKLKTALLLFIVSSTALIGAGRAGGHPSMGAGHEGGHRAGGAAAVPHHNNALSPAQKRNLEQQEANYVPFSADEEEYEEATNPEQDINQGADFYLEDHPLQEHPLQEEPVN